jgi:hypothetical protein
MPRGAVRRALPCLLVLLALAGCASPPGEPLSQGEEPGAADETVRGWADAATAPIRPGVPIHTQKRDCPSNFLFIRPDNTSIFLGSTAYCFRDMPVGTIVTVGGPENLGVLIYSSWETMAERNESDPDAREYNDFAVVRIDESLRDKVSPSLLQLGGPTALGEPAGAGVGTRVLAQDGNPSAPMRWRDGLVTGRVGDWALLVHSPLPVTPGNMGGAVVSPEGAALGVVVNIGAFPNAGANGVARLDALMAYADEHAKLYMDLVTAPLG